MPLRLIQPTLRTSERYQRGSLLLVRVATNLICNHYQVTSEALKSRRRRTFDVLPRFAWWTLLYRIPTASYETVGTLADRDASTIHYGISAFADRRETDPKAAAKFDEVQERFLRILNNETRRLYTPLR